MFLLYELYEALEYIFSTVEKISKFKSKYDGDSRFVPNDLGNHVDDLEHVARGLTLTILELLKKAGE